MAWITLSQTESRTFHDVIQEVEGGSPRAVAIVSAAFVEDHLTKAICKRLKQERIKSNVDLQGIMFRPSGPLGDFGNKINLAYLMGIISADAWKELDTIRSIRNRFAHSLEINRWNFQWLIARCNNLSLWERKKIKIRRATTGDPRRLVLILGESISEDEQELPMVDLIDSQPPLLANERYIAACKFYVAAFSIVIHEEYRIPTPAF